MSEMRGWVIRYGWLLLLLLAVGNELYKQYQHRPVMDFSLTESSYVAAKRGDAGSLTYKMTKVREPCAVKTDTLHLVLRDSAGSGFRINQHSGASAGAIIGVLEQTIQFEVPRFATPGPATVSVSGTFSCGGATIVQQTPPYPYEVLGE